MLTSKTNEKEMTNDLDELQPNLLNVYDPKDVPLDIQSMKSLILPPYPR